MLDEKIKENTDGLFYLSETDAPVNYFTGAEADDVTGENLLREIKGKRIEEVQEISFDEFFKNPTLIRDGAGDREVEYATRFSNLKELLENNLKSIKVFKVGKMSLDIYIVGLDENGNLTGVQTQATET